MCSCWLWEGGPFYGRLELCGSGKVKEYGQIGHINDLQERCFDSNRQLAEQLKKDAWEAELHHLTLEDADLDRMNYPVLFSDEHMLTLHSNQRF